MYSSDWNNLTDHRAPYIHPQLIHIGESLWYSTSYDGWCMAIHYMEEYCIKSNTIKQIVKYPQNIKPGPLCKHNNNIYIVDGKNGEIILFNPSTKQFKQIIKIPKIGGSACCLAMYDNIYIFHGQTNNCKYFRYSIKENKINTLNDKITKSNMTAVSLLRYKDTIIRFGGVNWDAKKCMDRFIISTQIKRNECKWTEIRNYKLPKPMCGFGSLIYRNYIVIFGGSAGSNNYLDTIYLLDLNNRNNKWIKLNHVKCPLKGQYLAVLDSNNNNIHLFTRWSKDNKKHYSIPILGVLGDIVLREELNIIRTEKNQLLENENKMKQEIERLKKENIHLNEECKEIKLELNEIQKELNKMKRIKRIKNTNLENYLDWSSDELIDWIISLEEGRYEKYEHKLHLIFTKEQVDGSIIANIDKTDWRNWGIANFKDRIDLHKYVQKLIHNNEGVNITSYIL